MALVLYAHPFSSYCWKALIAIGELSIAVEQRMLSPDHPDNGAAWSRHWPLQRMPVLVDGDRVVPEATIVIEHLELHHARERRLIPADPAAALEVRLMDRIFDNYVMTPMQKIVLDRLRPEPERDDYGVAEARRMLDRTYALLDERLADRVFAAGDDFTLADCAAAPSLFYADWAHPIADRFPAVAAYRARLLARPSVARVVDDARPYRAFFPLGAPDRD